MFNELIRRLVRDGWDEREIAAHPVVIKARAALADR